MSLTVAVGLFQSWFLVGDLIALITAILLMIYYRQKLDKSTFWAGLLATATSCATPLYLILATLFPLLGKYPKVITGLGVIIYLATGTTLVLSRASSRP